MVLGRRREVGEVCETESVCECVVMRICGIGEGGLSSGFDCISGLDCISYVRPRPGEVSSGLRLARRALDGDPNSIMGRVMPSASTSTTLTGPPLVDGPLECRPREEMAGRAGVT